MSHLNCKNKIVKNESQEIMQDKVVYLAPRSLDSCKFDLAVSPLSQGFDCLKSFPYDMRMAMPYYRLGPGGHLLFLLRHLRMTP